MRRGTCPALFRSESEAHWTFFGFDQVPVCGTTTRQTMHDINKELEKFFQLLEEAESSTNEDGNSPGERANVPPSPDRQPNPPSHEAAPNAAPRLQKPVDNNAQTARPATPGQARPAGNTVPSGGAPTPARSETQPAARPVTSQPPQRPTTTPARPQPPRQDAASQPLRQSTPPPRPVQRTAPPAGTAQPAPAGSDVSRSQEQSAAPKPYNTPRVEPTDVRSHAPTPYPEPPARPDSNQPARVPVPPAAKKREFPSSERADEPQTQNHSNLDQLMQEVKGKLNQPARQRSAVAAPPALPLTKVSPGQTIVVDPPVLAEAAKVPTWRKGVLTGLAIVLPACLALAIILNRPSGNFDIDTSSALAQNANALPDEQAELSMTSSPPGARVFLDGELFGVTPFESVRIKPGTYSVSVELPGYDSIDTTLTVRARHWVALNIPGAGNNDAFYADAGTDSQDHILAGLESDSDTDAVQAPEPEQVDDRVTTPAEDVQSSRTTERLERRPEAPARPTTGSIVFTSNPAGASVYLDNQRRGVTPLTLASIPGGSHSVRYSLEGYEDYAIGLELTPGIQTPLHGDLRPAYGTVVLDVESTGTVFIDGTLRESDVSGQRTYQLSAGTHTIAVQRSGMTPWELTATVNAGEAQTIVAEMPDSGFSEAYNEAEQLYATGEYQAAREAFERARTLQPDNRLVVGKLAEIDRLLESEQLQERVEAIIENGVYLVTDTPPKLVGGLEELHRNVKYPEAAYQAGVTGRVYIQFVVNEDGSASDLVVTKGLPLGCNEEAKRAVQSARYEPATFDGRKVKARHTLFVNFGQ